MIGQSDFNFWNNADLFVGLFLGFLALDALYQLWIWLSSHEAAVQGPTESEIDTEE